MLMRNDYDTGKGGFRECFYHKWGEGIDLS